MSTHVEVAIKSFNKAKYLQPGNAHLAQAMKNEIDVLRRLKPAKHAHIANIVEVLETHTAYVAVLRYFSARENWPRSTLVLATST